MAKDHPDEPLKICIANPWFYPVLVGPGERFRRYAPGLRKRGVDLSVVTIRHPDLPARGTVDGIEIDRLPAKSGVPWRERLFVYRLLPRYLRRENRPDVIQFFSANQWDIPFLLTLKLLRIPSLLIFTLMGKTSGSPLRRFLRILYLTILHSPFDRVVTSSGVMTEDLKALGVPPRRIDTIPNGVDLERFSPASPDRRQALRRQFGFQDRDEVVVCVGGIVPRKAVEVLLEGWLAVAEARPQALLVLVGDNHQPEFEAYRLRLDQLIRRLPDPGRVIFTGGVPNVEEYLQASDLFVFPSTREGMPNVVPEAMATGLATIVTPFRGLPAEFGAPGQDFSLVDRTPEALSAEILRLLADDEARENLGLRARAWVEQNLDVESSLDQFSAVYRMMARR